MKLTITNLPDGADIEQVTADLKQEHGEGTEVKVA